MFNFRSYQNYDNFCELFVIFNKRQKKDNILSFCLINSRDRGDTKVDILTMRQIPVLHYEILMKYIVGTSVHAKLANKLHFHQLFYKIIIPITVTHCDTTVQNFGYNENFLVTSL